MKDALDARFIFKYFWRMKTQPSKLETAYSLIVIGACVVSAWMTLRLLAVAL